MTRRRILFTLLLGLLAFGAYLSRQPYVPPDHHNMRLRLNYLEHVIKDGNGPNTLLGRLGRQNPEWELFSLSFTTYALANLAHLDSSLRAEAATYTDLAIKLALTPAIRQSFGEEPVGSSATADTAGSVLYLGHLNLMLGCHRQLVPDSPYRQLHDTLSAALCRRYGEAPSGNLPSYPHQRWLPDNTVALASLALHSRLTGSPYAAAGRRWVARAKTSWLDPATGLLASQVDAQGRVTEEPRGSMLGWSIWFLAWVDPAFARQQYQRYQATNSTNLGVWRFYRERPGHYATGAGDVDSGPLILGYGIPATATACADAVALRDWRNAQRLRRVISLGSREIVENGELRYGVRLVDLDVNPLSEALLLWAEVPG
ncbi:MAG: hypothetical protein ACRYFX_10685 [Janthinobacterium lividum]